MAADPTVQALSAVLPEGARGFAFAMEVGRLGLARLDADLRVVERSGALMDWMPEVGRPCDDSPVFFGLSCALRELQAGGEPLTLPSVRVHVDHADRLTISVVWDSASRTYVVVAAPDESAGMLERLLFHDRREKQLAQQQAAAAADRLRTSTTRYRDIVESAVIPVVRLNAELVVTYANAAAASLFGLPADAAVGRSIRDVSPLPRDGNPWRRDMCADGPAAFEQPLRDVTGGTIWTAWQARWLGDDDGPQEFQAIGRDITASRKLRAEADKAAESSRLAALADERLRIAHDLHDTFVRSLVDLTARLSLLRRAGAGGPLAEEIGAAEQEARAGLKAAREAVGEIRTSFDLPDGPIKAIEKAADALRDRTGVQVRCILGADLDAASPLQANAFVRVAREALRNVSLHSGARSVDVTGGRRGDGLALTIEDDGIGFDASKPRDGHYGLAGMREQARLAGGQLTIHSSLGIKTTLALVFPAP